MTRTDLKDLAELRLAEAKALLPVSPSGAYHLAGYAAEFALKACFIRSRHDEFPDRQSRDSDPYTHDLTRLLRLARLEAQFGIALGADPALSANWSIIIAWSEESRYTQWSLADATNLLNALEDVDHGVMRWLRMHW